MPKPTAFFGFLLCLALLTACGGGGGGGDPVDPGVAFHPLLTDRNAYGGPAPELAQIVAPSELGELVESGGYTLLTAADRQAALDECRIRAIQDRAEVESVFADSPELLTRIQRNLQPNHPDYRVLANGNVLVRKDGIGGIEPIRYQLDGPHISDRELVSAKRTFETKETQVATYEMLYELLGPNYRASRNLPDPQDVQDEDYDFFLGLNDTIGGDWQLFMGQGGVQPPPQGYPASWRDEEGAGTELQPALGLDRGGPVGLPTGLWSQVDFPLKWCATRVRCQGARGTCVFFSITAAIEARVAALHGRWVNLSEQFFYNQARKVWLPGEYGDSSWPLITIPNMKRHAFTYPFEHRWDYNRSLFRRGDDATMTYSRSCWADGSGAPYLGRFCSETSHQSPMICAIVGTRVFCATIDPSPLITRDSGIGLLSAPVISHFHRRVANHGLAKAMLALKIPIVYCYDVPDRTHNIRPSGLCPFDPTANSITGAHCAVILGYIPNADLPAGTPPGSGGGYYIIKNSWGTDFGDNGYFYAPDDWVAKYLISMYAVMQVTV